MSFKHPEYYKNTETGALKNTCDYDTRKALGCTEQFLESGFLKDSRWDRYAEYDTRCKNCEHYCHGVGIYFGDGKTTDNIKERDIIWCRCRIKTSDELAKALSFMPKDLKAIMFDDVRCEALDGLEAFKELECVLIGYSPKLVRFWDLSKTPDLKILEYVANVHLTDLSELARAKSLEYLGIMTLTSRTGMNYVDSFEPLAELKKLKELRLEAVMSRDGNMDHLINIEKLEKIWISPHTFNTEDFAKFEALKFKIYGEYGIFSCGDDARPLGKGGRCFRSEKSKEKYRKEYAELMEKYKKEPERR